jgi:transcriptional regulator with XRE-family HTH domain
MAASGQEQRRVLVGTLVRRERRRQRLQARQLADKLDMSTHTLSKIENGHGVSEEKLIDVAAWFGWDTFLDFVLSGNLDAANKVGQVDAGIREFAILRMREIADPDLYRKPHGGLSEDTAAE